MTKAKVLIVFVLIFWYLDIAAQNDAVPFAKQTTKENRAKEYRDLIGNIYSNISLPLTDSTQGGADVVVYPTQSTTLRDKLTLAGVTNQYVLYPTGGHGNWDAATYTDAFNKIQVFLTANVQ